MGKGEGKPWTGQILNALTHWFLLHHHLTTLLPGAGRQTMVNEIAVHCVDVVSAEPETDLAVLAIGQGEEQPNCAARKMREALFRGQTSFSNLANSFCNRPRCYIPVAAFTLVAVSDPRDKLEAGRCYVVVHGEALVGQAAVWRMPCHSPADLEVMSAVHPPDTSVLPDKALALSRQGFVNSGLAGGDLDGDLSSVAFWPGLVDLARRTAERVRTLDMSALDADITPRRRFDLEEHRKLRKVPYFSLGGVVIHRVLRWVLGRAWWDKPLALDLET